MYKKILSIVMCSMLLLVVPFSSPANKQAAMAQTNPGPANTISVDVTINPKTGELSVGGYSAAQLRMWGFAPIQSSALDILNRFQTLNVDMDATAANVNVDQQPLATINWSNPDRNALMGLAQKYGIQMNPNTAARAEEWIGTSQINLSVRMTPELSDPFKLDLNRPVVVDVSQQGQVSVEDVPLAFWLRQDVLNIAEQGGVKNAVVCWNNGTLVTKVNGDSLPSITLHSEGIQVLNQSLNIGAENLEALFSSTAGVDLALPGGTHYEGATCNQ